MDDLYKGHANLAEMIRGHLANLRAGLTALREVSRIRDDADDTAYWDHEIKAFGEIELAVHTELTPQIKTMPAHKASMQNVPQVGEVYQHQNGLAYTVIALAKDQDREPTV